MRPLSKSVAYIVKDERLNLYIAILDINTLHVHEEVIPEFLEQLTLSIKRDGCIWHPIIVDRESLTVLDGVHRIAALKKLGIKRAPVCLVDYENSQIKLRRWYRTITDASNPEHILAKIRQTSVAVRKTEKINEDKVGVSPTVSAIKFRNRAFLVRSSFQSLREAYALIERMEHQLRRTGLKIKHETERDALQSLQKGQVDAVLLTPRLTKKEIVETAVSGRVFASKTTRHVIPARPMCINVPLDLLIDEKTSLAEANEKLRSMLERRHLRRVPPGGLVNGRRYEEELYIFEE